MNKKRKESSNILAMTPEEAQAFIRKIMGPPRRVLEGKELEHVWLMIQLRDEPDEFSNNQRSICEVYKMNQREYHVHYFEGETIVEEILNDE